MDDRQAFRRLKKIQEDIGDRVLVAVTKAVGPDQVGELYRARHRVFGESRVKDAEEKIKSYPDAEWHMIGHLQGNKAKEAARLFSWIDSVDSVTLAEKLSSECVTLGKKMDVLMQVNVGREGQKYGFAIEEAGEAARRIVKLPGIRFRGLMAIAPRVEAEKTREYFKEMKKLFETMRKEVPGIDTLSMGMSGDYLVAAEEGSTMVRVGTALWR